jgi:3-methyladenine DNA glycosylase Mpg
MSLLPFNYSAVKREVITQQKATLSSTSTQIQSTTIPFAELYLWRFYIREKKTVRRMIKL